MKKTFKVIAFDTRVPSSMVVVSRNGEAWRVGGTEFLNIGETINANKLNEYSWDWGKFSAFEKLPTMPLQLAIKAWQDN